MDGLMRVVLWILAAIAVVSFFGITVFVHELGHYVAARLCGMRIDTFSIGFGPPLWKRRVGPTLYKIGWIPFGGYVALPQLDPSGMAAVQGENTPDGAETSRTLAPVAWWKRIVVSLAGPCGNIVLAFLVALLLATFPPVGIAPGLNLGGPVIGRVAPASDAQRAGLRSGDEVLRAGDTSVATWDEFATECHLASGGPDRSIELVVSNRLDGSVRAVTAPLSRNEATTYYGIAGLESIRLCGFGEVVPGWPAAQAGIATNDLAVAVNGMPLYGSEALIEAIQSSEGRPLAIRVLRQQALLDLTVTPRFSEVAGRWQIGVLLENLDPKVPMWMQYRRPLLQLKGDFQSVGRVLRALVAPKRKGESRRVAAALSGPIVILTTLWLNTLANLLYTLGFVRFLNVNLAVINLLPLPVLDGGHIVFALYEGITRRKVHPKLLNVLVNGFAILLITLFVVISVRDTWLLSRLFGRGKPVAAVAADPAAVADDAGEKTAP